MLPNASNGSSVAPSLLDAVLAVDPAMVQLALAQGHRPDSWTEDRQTPLHVLLLKSWDAESADGPFFNQDRPSRAVAILNLFLDAGMPPDVCNGMGERLLWTALRPARCTADQDLRLAVALRLLQAGADVDQPGPQGSVLWDAMAAVAPLDTDGGPAQARSRPGSVHLGEAVIEALLARRAPLSLPALCLTPLTIGEPSDLRGVRYAVPQGDDRLGALPNGSETLALRAVRSRSMAALEHVLELGANVEAIGRLVRTWPSGVGVRPYTPAMLATEMGWDEGLDRVARALLDVSDGRGLARELAQPMWQAERLLGADGRHRSEASLRTLLGFQRLERWALEGSLAGASVVEAVAAATNDGSRDHGAGHDRGAPGGRSRRDRVRL